MFIELDIENQAECIRQILLIFDRAPPCNLGISVVLPNQTPFSLCYELAYSCFDDTLIEQFMKTAVSHEFHVLMLESNAYCILPNEKRTTIDTDLCEF